MGAAACAPKPETDALGALDATVEDCPDLGSFPKTLSPQAVEAVKASAPDVVSRAEVIARSFSQRLLERRPALKGLFDATQLQYGHQHKAFAAALAAFASNVEQIDRVDAILDQIAARHAAAFVRQEHYLVAYEALMAALGEALGEKVTPEVASGWSELVLLMARRLMEREERLYKQAEHRRGGWRGFRDFVVAQRQFDTPAVLVLTLRPAEPGEGEVFDFLPGQSLRLRVALGGEAACRHYSIISRPSEPHFVVAIKKVPGGKVSTFLHANAQPGFRLSATPPGGSFVPKTEPCSAVLISAGIGIAPITALLHSMKARVALAVHVDKSEQSHAFKKRFLEAGVKTRVRYTGITGRPPRDFATTLARDVGTEHEFYICAPGGLTCDVVQCLLAAGVKPTSVHVETFGPQLCPSSG